MTTVHARMMTVSHEREQRLPQQPRVLLVPLPMVVGFLPFHHAAQPRFMKPLPLPLLEPSPNSSVVIRQVWAANVDSEFRLISSLIDRYQFVSVDTEFPGVIIQPRNKNYRNLVPEETYQLMKANVDALKIIQLGLTLSDERGNLPDLGTNNKTHYIWQFNFCDFNFMRDIHAKDSVALLRSQGIDFARNAVAGVSSMHFAKLAATSGLLFNKALTWVTFHGAYDIGYLVKILTRGILPNRLEEFLKVVKELFGGNAYDVKHVMRFCDGLYGGLEKVADTLQVDRVAGKCHQAGSDSLLTCHTFQKIRETYFLDNDDGFKKYANIFFGWIEGDALELSFSDGWFDAITMGYGLRNAVDRPKAMQEILRVLKAGSRVISLDFNKSRELLTSIIAEWMIGNVVVPMASAYGLSENYKYLKTSIRGFLTGLIN